MKSSVLGLFTFSQQLVTEGAPVTFPKNDDQTVPTFYVGRSHSSNPGWQAANERETAKYRGRIQSGKMTAKDWANITKETFITTLLQKWENFYDAEGAPIPFNEENARKYMDEYPELYEHLAHQSTLDELYRKTALDNDAGN